MNTKAREEFCGNCRFHIRDGCRRHAPAVFVTIDASQCRWPVVSNTDWCGDWVERDHADAMERSDR